MLSMYCVCHAFVSVHCCLVVTCWERADLLALVCDVYCDFVTFPFGILGLVWYLIVLIPDPCHFSYFQKFKKKKNSAHQYQTASYTLVNVYVDLLVFTRIAGTS